MTRNAGIFQPTNRSFKPTQSIVRQEPGLVCLAGELPLQNYHKQPRLLRRQVRYVPICDIKTSAAGRR